MRHIGDEFVLYLLRFTPLGHVMKDDDRSNPSAVGLKHRRDADPAGAAFTGTGLKEGVDDRDPSRLPGVGVEAGDEMVGAAVGDRNGSRPRRAVR